MSIKRVPYAFRSPRIMGEKRFGAFCTERNNRLDFARGGLAKRLAAQEASKDKFENLMMGAFAQLKADEEIAAVDPTTHARKSITPQSILICGGEEVQLQNIGGNICVTSTRGGRKNNEDGLAAWRSKSEDHVILAVADGMGGHHGGEIASAMALQMIFELIGKPELDFGNVVKETGKLLPGESGTTLTQVEILGNKASINSVGDSRVYLIRAGEVRLLTLDETKANKEFFEDLKIFSPFLKNDLNFKLPLSGEETKLYCDFILAFILRHQNPISNVLINKYEIKVFPPMVVELQKGDIFVVTSDGFPDAVPHYIFQALAGIYCDGKHSLSQFIEALRDEALENAQDNISILGYLNNK